MAGGGSGSEANAWDRVAARTADSFVSVLHDALHNPLWSALEELGDCRRLSVADLGCGRGELLPHLLRRGFERVLGVDASASMIASAAELLSRRDGSLPDGVLLRHARIEDLDDLEACFDVVVSLNSLIEPDPQRLARMLERVGRSLRAQGRLLAVFPSHETLLESARFHQQRLRARGLGRRRARQRLQRMLELDRFDSVLGVYDHGDGLRQKYVLREELVELLRAAGFSSLRLDRVVYDQHVSFRGRPLESGEPAVWHWFVSCRRG